MKHIKNIFTTVILVLVIQISSSCADNPKKAGKQTDADSKLTKKYNPVVYFEIPVNNIERAINFYKTVFNFHFHRENIDNNEMALFPFMEENSGISGALAKGEIYKPTKDGVVIYFKTENIDKTLKLATENGGQVLYPRTDNGLGLVAEFEDTEGNRIALYQSTK
ncbi:VOC family protein [Foetidibacter luteolus]|uniref:VOC family protein n=1 Tax=Foetidibacter luteolus TaxID=2608880 RepID=UPI00129A46A8|nr:VOC family protein [Foetidibacter luteolus]